MKYNEYEKTDIVKYEKTDRLTNMIIKSADLAQGYMDQNLRVMQIIDLMHANAEDTSDGRKRSRITETEIALYLGISKKAVYNMLATRRYFEVIAASGIFVIDNENRRLAKINYFSSVIFENGVLQGTYTPEMAPHIGRKKNRTAFAQNNPYAIGEYKNKYGYLLYDFLSVYKWRLVKGYSTSEHISVPLGKLKYKLGMLDTKSFSVKNAIEKGIDWNKIAEEISKENKYCRANNFIKAVMDAVLVINNAKYSEIAITDVIKETNGRGGKITDLTFIISLKDGVIEPKRKKISESTKKAIEYVDLELVEYMKQIFDGYPLEDEDVANIVIVAGNDKARLDEAIEVVQNYDKPIYNLITFLICAIDEGWKIENKTPYISGKTYEQTQICLRDLAKWDEEEKLINDIVTQFLQEEITENDFPEEHESVIRKCVKARYIASGRRVEFEQRYGEEWTDMKKKKRELLQEVIDWIDPEEKID